MESPLAQAHYEVNEDDLIALHTRVMRTSPLFEETRRRNWRTGIQAGLMVMSVFAGAAYLTAPNPTQGIYRVGFWIFAYAIIWPLFAYRTLTRAAFDRKVVKTATRFVREGKVPYAYGPCDVQLFADRVSITESDGTMTKPWRAAKATVQESDAVFIDFTDGMMLRIPNRGFHDEAARADFVEQVTSRIAADH